MRIPTNTSLGSTHLQRMQIGYAIWMSESGNGLHKELSRLVLQMEKIIGSYSVEYLQQRRPVGP